MRARWALCNAWLALAAAWALSFSAPARAEGAPPLILVSEKVSQYREAADAAQKKLPGAVRVDPADAEAGAKAKEAPVIIAVGQRAWDVAKQANGPGGVVFCMVLGVNRASVTGNTAGVPMEPDPSSTFAQMKSVAPRLKKLGIIYDPRRSEAVMEEAQRVAGQHGLTLVLKQVGQGTEVRGAAEVLAGGGGGGVDALWLPTNPQLVNKELFSFLLGFAAERKLPLFGFLDSFTEAGALASMSPDYRAEGEKAGTAAAEALARGGKVTPGLLFARSSLTVNLRTAKALGIEVSAGALTEAKQVTR